MKQLEKTEKIKERIRRIAGEDVDLESLVVYEAISLNTLPLYKRGSIYHEARFTESTLHAMADLVQGGTGIPLQVMHEKGALPVGKVFWAETRRNPHGITELRTLFYLDKREESLIAKLETGTVDEVSVGLLSKHAFCSKCHFDFLGDGATVEHLWARTDPEGHVIGVDDTHLVLDGITRWFELSLVGTGAANNAKIVGRSAAVLSAEDMPERLVASGFTPSMTALFATATKPKDQKMELEKLVDQLTDLKVELKQSEAKVAELEAKLAEKEELEAKVAELEAKLAEKDELDSAKLQDERDTVVAKLSEITKKVLVASGSAADDLPDDVQELVAKYDDAQAKLASLLPLAGGLSLSADADPKNSPRGKLSNSEAFKVRK